MLIAAIVVIALLAAVAVFSALKSRDADGAVGILSRETKSRDRESTVLGDEDALTGKQVERAQVLERKAASKELVLAARESAPPAPMCRRIPRSSASRVVSSSTAPSSS